MGLLLAVDVGNTDIAFGVFREADLIQSWRLQTLRGRTSDELWLLVDGLFSHSRIERPSVDGIIVGSVVPSQTGTIRSMAERYFGITPFIVEPSSNAGMPILYENPSEIGADRIVNAIAAFEQFGRQAPRPVIVCDFGTATTLDAVTAAGEYLGGAICPGVTISADALFQRAARLPRVEVRKPSRVVGQNTVGAIESGLFWGYVGMVDGLLRRIEGELDGTAVCVATGGLASVIAPEIPMIDHVDVDLTLHGLGIVWRRNRK
jgi:type III pantothenate kinase